MLSRSRPRRFASWIAVLAVLMAALAPALSQAFGSGVSSAWLEICTVEGSKWVQAGAAPADDSSPSAEHTLEHCPYCTLQVPHLGLPPSALASVPTPDLAHAVPLAFLAAPRRLHAWVSAQPRAPPTLS
jgi:hypothetical protein